ncbi:uncharacterized protein LOC121660540 isoform X2 [Corvus kubaryi]|uniref:uncharacterized protein LOC121660540 isoform X2 n=1 Tax=Corvus kubaryi TaxID=68294 RepID=UPI001C052C1D|nr:uncharacterized protein LOC121660540 isoform X2 [Corvus kubaryi]
MATRGGSYITATLKMAARPEVTSASTQDGSEGQKLRHHHTKYGGRLRCFLTFSIWRQGKPPQAASIRMPEHDADADASPALARNFLRCFPLCGHQLWGQRRLGQAGAFRQPNRRSGVLPAAILRRSKSHIGAVPVTSALFRQERQWRGARGAALPGRGHRGGCSGLGAKNIQNCHLTPTDSRNVFHSSCFGMGMAVGSSGRTGEVPNPCECEAESPGSCEGNRIFLGNFEGLALKHNRGNPGGAGKRCPSVGGIPGKWKAAEVARTELEAGSSRERYKKLSKRAGMEWDFTYSSEATMQWEG